MVQRGLDIADMVHGSLLSTKGAMVFTPRVYKHQLQAHTAVGSWALSTTELSFLGKDNWPGGDTAQAARHSTLAPAGVFCGQWGTTASTQQGPRRPWGTCKDEGKARQRKTQARSCSQKFKPPHRAHPLCRQRFIHE